MKRSKMKKPDEKQAAQEKQSDSLPFEPPLLARDQMIKEIQKEHPELTEEQLTLMGL